jgi:hypothetical protein
MTNDDISTRRAIQTLIEEVKSRNDQVPVELVQNIYDIEEGVQFLDDRGPIADRIAKLIGAELNKEDI